jgi:hypothetical protein
MGKLSRFLLLLFLRILTSCFSSRKTQTETSIPTVDPVRTTLDTTTHLVKVPKKAVDTIALLSVGIDSIAHESQDMLIPKIATFSEDTIVEILSEDVIDTICIIGTGDVMPGTNFPDNRYLPPGNDCSKLFVRKEGLQKNVRIPVFATSSECRMLILNVYSTQATMC